VTVPRPALSSAFHRALPRASLGAVGVAAVGALVLGVASWPAGTVAIGIVLVIAFMSWRAPRYAFIAALGAFGAEGSVKILLTNGGSPFPSSPDAAGAALLDAALFLAVVGVLAADRGRTPVAVWKRANRAERLVLGGLGAWLIVSVLELPLGGNLSRSLAGLRLTHAYVLCAAAALIAFAPDGTGERAVTVLLALLGVIAGYACLRVLIGPAAAEQSFAQARSVTAYAGAFRAVGSFSGAVGLESFVTPTVSFGLVLGWLSPRWRALSWTVAALALVAEFGSYGRTPLLAIAVAVLAAGALTLSGGQSSGRRKVAVAVAVGVVLAALSVGTIVAASGSATLRTRAQGLVNPAGDKSVNDRLDTWRWAVRQIGSHPLGQGLGSVGRATGSSATSARAAPAVTTDNSYLKVTLEQGIPVGLLFTFVVLGACVVVARRSRRLSATRRALSTAALAGFASFLVLLITTDDLEQPGKVLAWAMLGLAFAQALGSGAADRRVEISTARRRARSLEDWRPRVVGAALTLLRTVGDRARSESGRRRLAVVIAVLALTAGPLVITLSRSTSYTARVEAFPAPVPGVLLMSLTDLRNLLKDPGVRQFINGSSGLVTLPDPVRGVRIDPGPHHGTMSIVATAAAPERARILDNAAGNQLAAGSSRQIRLIFALQAIQLARMLQRGSVPPAQAPSARARLSQLVKIAHGASARIVLGPRAPTPPVMRWGDRLVAHLPGAFPPRPSPVVATTVGLVLGVSLWLAGLWWLPPPLRRPRGPAGPARRS